MSGRFAGRRALVSGANSGIGREIAQGLVDGGARVVGVDLRIDELPDGVEGVVADVSSPDDVDRLAAFARERVGTIDTLFNNAGIGSTSDVLGVDPEEWDRVFAVNVRGVYLAIRAFLPGMLADGAGVIVNTASAAGLVGLPDRAAYCASKGAVIALTKQVAVQWARDGIRCNCICPGTIDSAWVGRLLSEADDPVAERERLVDRQPMGRLGEPREAAAAALYLASDEASFITGAELVVDGGIVAG